MRPTRACLARPVRQQSHQPDLVWEGVWVSRQLADRPHQDDPPIRLQLDRVRDEAGAEAHAATAAEGLVALAGPFRAHEPDPHPKTGLSPSKNPSASTLPSGWRTGRDAPP
jgi:hypothetical protein